MRERGEKIVLAAVGLAQRLLGGAAFGDVQRRAHVARESAAIVEVRLRFVVNPTNRAIGEKDAVLVFVSRALLQRCAKMSIQLRGVLRMDVLTQQRGVVGRRGGRIQSENALLLVRPDRRLRRRIVLPTADMRDPLPLGQLSARTLQRFLCLFAGGDVEIDSDQRDELARGIPLRPPQVLMPAHAAL